MTDADLDRDLLTAVLDTVHPADEDPGAAQTGLFERLIAVLDDERPEWSPRVRSVLDSLLRHCPDFAEAVLARRTEVLTELAADAEQSWFTALVNDLFYGETPSPGGRTAGRRLAGWPDAGVERGEDVDLPPSALTGWEQLQEGYDVVVLGAGAGGGLAAHELAASGRRVLLVERGGWPATAELRLDDLRSARSSTGLDARSGPTGTDEPRRIPTRDGGTLLARPADPGWGNNAMMVGGGTRVYGAQAWRFAPADFQMATRYGTPEGSSLADWPIGYDDLEPHYSHVEHELGVSGGGPLSEIGTDPTTGDPWAGPRSQPLPMPAMSPTLSEAVLRRGAGELGWRTLPVPLLVNSTPWGGRAACTRCSQCIGFACPVDAKTGTHNTSIPAALATGRCSLTTGVVADRLLTGRGRVRGVSLVHRDADGELLRREVSAGQVVLACGAVETARLLLLSAHAGEPDGIGNAHDQVGRHLQGHLYGGATGVMEEEVVDFLGPGPSIATCDLRHGNPGLIGGGMLANEFVATPANTFRYLAQAGLVPTHGADARTAMRQWGRRMIRVMGPIQEVTSAGSRVLLDRGITDGFGRPGVQLAGSLHPEDLRNQSHLAERAEAWLLASGALRTGRSGAGSLRQGPSVGQHQAGTCRMGTDPASSVTDPDGRVWGHDNVYVVDGSTHVTNGGVNPVLTILANSHRIVSGITGERVTQPDGRPVPHLHEIDHQGAEPAMPSRPASKSTKTSSGLRSR